MKTIVSILIILLTLSMSELVNAQIPTSGLVAYWPFNGNAKDESGNKNDGMVYGASLTSDRFGNMNSAYNFDGVNDYIFIKDSSILNPNTISICAWYKTISFGGEGNNAIIDKGYTSHSTPYYQYHIGVTGDSYFYEAKSQFITNIAVDNKYIPLSTEYYFWNKDEWYFLCTTYDGQNAKFYVNNTLICDSVLNGTIDNYGQDIFIGKFGNRSDYTPGVIDDIRIYNRAINETEVLKLFQEGRCTDLMVNDTTTYYVSSADFMSESPKVIFDSSENLFTEIGSCDSTVNHYSSYIYNSNVCTETIYDTIAINDTVVFNDTITEYKYVTVYDTIVSYDTVEIYNSISVTDTLIIDVIITGLNISNKINKISIYPNPAKDYVIINTGDYSQMSSFKLEIINPLGQAVFKNSIDQQEFIIDVSSLGGYGIYIVKIYNSIGETIESKKIIIQ